VPSLSPTPKLMVDTPPEYVGFICCIVAGTFFGSNFVPVKKFPTGDGIFFQWIMCSAIWVCGFIVLVAREFPPFQPFAMLGGFLWCTGNMLTVPIIKLVGLGIGLGVWATCTLVVGWSNGFFGILGVQKQPVNIRWLSYLGAFLAALSAVFFALVKPEESRKRESSIISPTTPQINGDPLQRDWTEKFTHKQKRILGVVLSLIAGLFFGTNFNPPQYVMEHCLKCSQNGLDYVFSQFTGIFLTSTFYFLLYCVWVNNRPLVYPEAILPGYLSGMMWGIAQICWFVANSALNLVISFPIVAVLPTVVSTMCGILLFKEIKGKKNFMLLSIAYLCSISSICCTALSKVL